VLVNPTFLFTLFTLTTLLKTTFYTPYKVTSLFKGEPYKLLIYKV